MNKKYSKIFELFLVLGIPLIAIIGILSEPEIGPIKWIVLGIIILFSLVFSMIYFYTIKKDKAYHAHDVLWADLEEFFLPKFIINKKSQRQFQTYNFNILNKNVHSPKYYAPLPFKISLITDTTCSTTLYYVSDVIFVNCKSPEESWWGICKNFEEQQLIWELFYDFEMYYEEQVKFCAKSTEILNHTKIKVIPQHELEDLEIDP